LSANFKQAIAKRLQEYQGCTIGGKAELQEDDGGGSKGEAQSTVC